MVGAGTIAELNVPVAERITQLRVNLDRGRVLLHDLPEQFVVVNIAGYTIYLVSGQQVSGTRACRWARPIGARRSFARTSRTSSSIRRGPSRRESLTRISCRLLDRTRSDHAQGTAGIRRCWARVESGSDRLVAIPQRSTFHTRCARIPVRRMRLAGSSSCSPTRTLVYLHDTPSQSLFERADRAFSSGCVRVERALELAELVLNDAERWNQDAIAQSGCVR